MFLLTHTVDILNKYANLLLASFTLIYVWLTYQMLKSLRHESLRDVRIRHLQDIKSDVAEPILAWFDNRVLPMLHGDLPFISVTYVKIIRPTAQLDEPQYDSELCLTRLPLGFPNMGHLFSHAERTHFGWMLRAVDDFKTQMGKLSEEYLKLANVCDEGISKRSLLPKLVGIAHPEEFADNCYCIEESLKCLLRGEWPEFRFEGPVPFPAGRLLMRAPSDNRVVAIGSRENVERWAELSRQEIEKRWNISDLETKTENLLASARLVREVVSRIVLTYDLRGDCEYIGGRSAGPLAKLWHRFFRDRGHAGAD
jgi:hypothetical protein